ncbi:MAG TPA: diacylglycerol kinase family protein [Solirubrobacteraceae bacterium]|nr:diacylglycerol kinase family protein [Solirubrobacteraceae bacterium]
MASSDAVAVADAALLEAPVVRRRMLVVVNPAATSVDPRLRALVLAALRSRYEVTAVDTVARGHAMELGHRAVAEDFDVVVTLGGDGTLNEVAGGLAGSSVPLCPLPAGSQNVFAKMLGLPHEIVDATAHLLRLADDWRPRRIDLGRVNGRIFTFSAGAGIDAAVVEHVDAHPARKARWRQWYYMHSAALVFATRYALRAPRLEVDGPEGPIEGVTVLVQNGDPYTYAGERPVRVCRDVALDSGTLSAAVLARTSPADASLVPRLLLERLEVAGHRHVVPLEHLHELRIRAAGDLAIGVQVDGDFIGAYEDIHFEVLPGALSVVA